MFRTLITSIWGVYTPPFNLVDDEAELRAMVAAERTGWLVTAAGAAAPEATLLPIIWRADTVIAHLARANSHWTRVAPGASALLIVGGAQAYVSPSWYAAKAEHGKVVPTWNYSAVHLSGTLTVHEDMEWLRHAVTDLTDTHERERDEPWRVTDAPEAYIDGQLRGIVGIELAVTHVEGKAKLSQNRSAADRQGVIAGLRANPAGHPDDATVAAAMDDRTPR